MIRGLIALAILDGVLAAAGWSGGIPAGWALAGHAVLGALGYALWLRGGARTGFAAAMLGVLGPLGLLATLPFARLLPSFAERSDDAMFGPVRAHAARRGAGLAVARMLDGRVHHATPETLSSLVTIMRHGDVAARRRALETVVRSFEPALSPLIALALTDGDQTIRALAAAASARVAENLVLARAKLSARMATGTDPDAATALARLLADHARSDVLLSNSQRVHLREDAVATMVAAGSVEDDASHGALRDSLTIEALWAAGDYAAIDRIATTIVTRPDNGKAMAATGDRSATQVAAWWQTGTTA